MKRLCFSILLVTLLFSRASALGALYARLPRSTDVHKPLWLKSYDATVTITDQMAVTHADHVFKNETSSRLEGIFIFPLPEDAVVTELALWINGERVVGDVMEKDTARAIYESIVRREIDPALLEYMGDNVFKLSVFPIEPDGHDMSERRIEITYAQLLPYQDGRVSYEFLMKTANASPSPVGRASLSLNLTSQKRILSFSSPSHAGDASCKIREVSDHERRLVYGNEDAHSEKDLLVAYELENDDFALNHLTYVPGNGLRFFDRDGDLPYYLLWVTPPDDITKSQVLDKNIVFVADVSSSMAGERIRQLRASLKAMVDMLNKGDSFNIVAFSTGLDKFKPDIVPASAANKAEAAAFIEGLVEMGMTNMESALDAALGSAWGDTTVNTLVFLTDGLPTWPSGTTPERILSLVDAGNTGDIALHTFGIGAAVDNALLTRLARDNDGVYYLIEDDNAINAIMERFMRRISHPLIKDVTVAYGALDVFDTYPRTLPNMYAGTQLTVLGRYRSPATANVAFAGSQGAEEIVLKQTLAFPGPGENHAFVPRMWASAKIDYLLDEIAMYGENAELVTNVKELGKKYGIITPYTSMLVVEPDADLTDVLEDKTMAEPASFRLWQVTDGHADGAIVLCYSIPKLSGAAPVRLRVYDSRGRLVRTLVNEITLGGNFRIVFDGRDNDGRALGAGFYVAILQVGSKTRMLRLRLLR
ncbi:MAG: VWA domain-containing protein [Chitinivibrionales bacterium]|nr:VWA domain-containing protein [Chitinivibrionales bacterium]MBD3396102.1 VWA domain-containing protein [Chitinivibrionales bacterium]